jgi:small subunit ribosomal protein S9
MSDTKTIKTKNTEEPFKFKGKFISTIGKRKTSTAQSRLYKNGRGVIVINNIKINKYFTSNQSSVINQLLKLTGHIRDLDFSVKVDGGGKGAQANATMLGIARALVIFDKNLRPSIKAKGWLTRDARKKERKKPGLKKARRAPQWSKR